jgi:hypothetical protein
VYRSSRKWFSAWFVSGSKKEVRAEWLAPLVA